MTDVIISTSGLEIGLGSFRRTVGDLSIVKGELIHVKGPNGCGKSTLLKTLAGRLSPIKGTYTFAQGLFLTYIPQHSESEILLPLTLKEWLNAYQAKNIPSNILPKSVLEKRWRDASGGEKQKVSLLSKIQSSGSILLLDEPFNHVDEVGKEETEDFIDELLQKNYLSTVIIVSHQALKRGRTVKL